MLLKCALVIRAENDGDSSLAALSCEHQVREVQGVASVLDR